MKNPILASLLNIIPGLGYIYTGRRKVFGVAVLTFVIVNIIANNAYDTYMLTNYSAEGVTVPLDSTAGILNSLSIILIPFMIGAFMYDAYRDAKCFNQVDSKRKLPLSQRRK